MNFKVILRLLQQYRDFHGKSLYYFSIIFGGLLSIFVTFEPFLFSKIIYVVEQYYKTSNFDFNLFYWYIIAWIIYIVINLSASFFYRYNLVVVKVLDFYGSIFEKYAEKTLYISYNTFLSKKQGEIFKRFDAGTENIFWFLLEFYNDLLKTFVGVFVIFIVLFFVDWRMSLAMSAMMPIMIFIGYQTNAKTSPQQRLLDDEYNKIFGNVSDSLTNMALVKTLTLEHHLIQNIKNDFKDVLSKQYSISYGWTYASMTTAIVIVLSRLFILGLGIYLIGQDSLDLATLFLFYSLNGWIYFPLTGLFERLRNIQKQIVSIEKFYDAFDDFEYEEKNDTGTQIHKIDGNLEFKKVSFAYNKGKNILADVSFSIKKGQKIALVGNTGAGKSTIVNLLFRLWDIENGEILLDGVSTKAFHKKSLRQHIGIVMQDNTLFNTSIRENLLLAKKKATKKELDDALKGAQADFVFALPNGIDTIIGERGLKLSGGEKQRINIARLLLKNPKVIILDEATSALDNTTEKEIQKSLDNLMKGRTAVIIAHRLSTIKHVDTIFVLEHGKIVESGNYNELMEKKAKFYRLANPDKLII